MDIFSWEMGKSVENNKFLTFGTLGHPNVTKTEGGHYNFTENTLPYLWVEFRASSRKFSTNTRWAGAVCAFNEAKWMMDGNYLFEEFQRQWNDFSFSEGILISKRCRSCLVNPNNVFFLCYQSLSLLLSLFWSCPKNPWRQKIAFESI